MKAVADITIKQ